MLIGWFIKFAPHLFEQGRIFRLNTPLIILKDSKGKIVKWFFNLNEYKLWEANNDVNKYKILYLKGLGSLEKEDLDYVISQVGLDGLLQELKLDKKANVYIEHWLGSNAEPRKEYLRNYTFNVDLI
jgi:DNA gyrase/topoisomerase IV subunit B